MTLRAERVGRARAPRIEPRSAATAARDAGHEPPGPTAEPPAIVVSVLPVEGARCAPRVETLVRTRPRGGGAGGTQRVYFVAQPGPALGLESRTERKGFLQGRLRDLRAEVEQKQQLAAVKRAHAAQLRARPAGGAAAQLEGTPSDGVLAALEGELATLESELSLILAQEAAGALSQADAAEGAARAIAAAQPAAEVEVAAVEVSTIVEPK